MAHDDGDPHFIIAKARAQDEMSVKVRGDVINAFCSLISNARDMELDDLRNALMRLELRDKRLYQSLLGNILLNDIIHAIIDENRKRCFPVADGGRSA